jgi:aminopeptidase-like protein
LYDSLPEGNYDVVLETRESRRPLRMLELRLDGFRPETLVVCANLDHAGLANDGIAGVAVGVEVFRRLAARGRLFSYRLVLCQGILGSEYYLGRQSVQDREAIFEALCLWMLGSQTQLALQQSAGARSNIERVLAAALRELKLPFRTGAFREIMINDEYIWESYGIPTVSLSRYPYAEYHCSRDDISIISEACLREAADAVERTFTILEASPLVRKKFTGTVCLSNPQYDLYVDAGQVAFGDAPDPRCVALRKLMDHLPSLTAPVTVASLAERFELAERDVEGYLRKWESAGLIALD